MIINVKFTELTESISASFRENAKDFAANFLEGHIITKYVGGKPYEGDYVVTPKVEEQIMPTKDKVLLEDVTIKSIPYFNVGNNSGGSTVYIGSEV